MTDRDLKVTEASLEEMLSTRLSVDSVTVQGASRTTPDLLKNVTSPVLSTGGTFSGVVDDVSLAIERLRATGCFRGVDAYVDRSASGADATVQFTVAEKPFYQLKTGTMIETNGEREGSLEGAFLWRNLRGRADTIKASVNWGGGRMFGKEPSVSWDIAYGDPFFGGLNCGGFAKIGGGVRNYLEESGYMLKERGGELGLDIGGVRLSVGNAWREVGGVEEEGGILVRENAGHTWKTFGKIEGGWDGRDSPIMPSEGICVGGLVEAAVPRLGDVSFVKGEGNAQLHMPFGASGISVGFSGTCGMVMGKGGNVPVVDRFFIGGNSMRGFSSRGVGPRDAGASVGGEAFYVLTGIMSMPVPKSSLLWQLFRARVHSFGTIGDLTEAGVVERGMRRLVKVDGGMKVGEHLKNCWKDFYGGMRATLGLGVALETSFGRVEVNFCQVVRAAEDDKMKAGIQIAISESFS